MKNRLKKHTDNIPSIEDLLKHIEENNKKILDNRDSYGVEAIGKIPVDEKGDYDLNRPTIIDINRLKDFHDLTRKRAEFTKEDMQALINLIPDLERLLEVTSNDTNDPFNASGLPLHIAENISDIPVERYIDIHHKDKSKDEQSLNEGLELGKMILSDLLPSITNKTFKSILAYMLMESLNFIAKHRDCFQYKGFDIFYDAIGEYKRDELKAMEETFKKRNEIPKDSLYRRDFLNDYIDNQVYKRFFPDNEKPFTPELGEEWDKHFNELCDEYGEQEYKRAFSKEDYTRLKCDRLCWYPESYNPAKSLHNAITTAEHFGLDEETIRQGFNIVQEIITERRPLLDKEIEGNKE